MASLQLRIANKTRELQALHEGGGEEAAAEAAAATRKAIQLDVSDWRHAHQPAVWENDGCVRGGGAKHEASPAMMTHVPR